MLTYPLVSPVEEINGIWKMFFDGAYSKERVGACIVLISPTQKEIQFSYKLEFEATNNVVEYEALILGLEATRKMQITKLVAFGDSELVVQQVKGSYQTRHPRMRAYRNQVWDMIDNFYEAFNIFVVLREFNQRTNSLVVATSTFKVPATPQVKCEIEMRYMLEYESCVLVLLLTIPLSPNHRSKPPSEHLNLDRESLRKQTQG
jgi:ribonuclease HI